MENRIALSTEGSTKEALRYFTFRLEGFIPRELKDKTNEQRTPRKRKILSATEQGD